MTVHTLALDDWATKPLGKAARLMIAIGGTLVAIIVTLLAAVVEGPAWVLVLGGVALAATSVRAAQFPTVVRLAVVMANLILIPLIFQMI